MLFGSETAGGDAFFPVVFNLFKRAAFGFGKVVIGIKQAENADKAEYPESVSFADGFQQGRENQGDDEVENKIGHGGNAHGCSANLERHDFGNENPGNRPERKGKAGDEGYNAADGKPFEINSQDGFEVKRCPEGKQADGYAA